MIQFLFEVVITVLAFDNDFALFCRCWTLVNDVDERLLLLELIYFFSLVENNFNARINLLHTTWVVQIDHLHFYMLRGSVSG